jgi:hypothetical protein
MAQPPNAAVFVARAWCEDGQFRARISYHVNIHSEPTEETRIVTVDPAEVRQHLAIWLDESTAAASS